MQGNQLRYILLEVTDKCNFRCKHCRVEGWEQINNPLTKREVITLIDQAKEMGVKTITFSGGEPLLRNDIIELIKYCSKKGIKSKLQSNSFLLTEPLAEKLKKAGLDIYGTGIDGSTSKIHNALRQMPKALQKVKKAIKIAKDKGFEIHTETTITKLNQNDIPKIIKLAKKIGVDYFFIRSIVVAGCAEKSLMITKEEYKKALEKVYLAKYPLGKMKITSQDPLFHLIDNKLMQRLENEYGDIYSGKYVGGCSAGLNSLNIKSDGSARLCSFLTNDLGNIRTNKLSKIWANKNIKCQDIISRNVQGKCKNCKDKLICGGCRARALILTNNILGEDPYCWK